MIHGCPSKIMDAPRFLRTKLYTYFDGNDIFQKVNSLGYVLMDYASGNYYLSGSGYITLPAGTHNLYLDFSAFGASYDYNMTIGQTDQDRFQVVVHR